MVVLDTSAVVDFLFGTGAATAVEQLLDEESGVAAPDVIVFEVMAVLRRKAQRGEVASARATAALEDFADLPLLIFPSIDLRIPAWRLRDNFTAADALFVTLAAELEAPLATKDGPMIMAIETFTGVGTVDLR